MSLLTYVLIWVLTELDSFEVSSHDFNPTSCKNFGCVQQP